MKELSVLFITRRFPPSVGGMEKFAFDLSNALGKKTKLHLIKWGGSNKYIPILLIPWFFLCACWVLLTKKVDVIHMQDGVFSIWGVVLKYVFRKPMTVVIHGLDITHEGKLYQFLVPKALKRSDHVFCISNMAVDEVVNRGVTKDKVSFVPLGMTDDLYLENKMESRDKIINQLKLDENTQIILSNGRLIKRKGVAWFVVNVMPGLVKKYGKIVLVVSGDGPVRAEIEQAIKSNDLNAKVLLLGQTSDQILQDLYNGSDLFVMPNIKVEGDPEGFGRVVLEAALCELPVVATGIEGIVDAISDGKNGVLVKEKDSNAFERKILELLKDTKEAKQFGEKARQYTLLNFDWDNIANQYVDEYKKLLG